MIGATRLSFHPPPLLPDAKTAALPSRLGTPERPTDWPAPSAPRPIDANELLWAARMLATLVPVHRNVIPVMRENVKVAQEILESYADVPVFDPREQRWTIARS